MVMLLPEPLTLYPARVPDLVSFILLALTVLPLMFSEKMIWGWLLISVPIAAVAGETELMVGKQQLRSR